MKATVAADPIALLQSWLDEAEQSESHNATAMALATVGASGAPSSRVEAPRRVNSKGDKRGPVKELLISGKR